jgi:hypothetical protein
MSRGERGWDEIAAEAVTEFPKVARDKMLVDMMTARLAGKPSSLDTIVATNRHADTWSDMAAVLAGCLGIAPIANLDPQRRFPTRVRARPWRRLRHRGAGNCESVRRSRRTIRSRQANGQRCD